MESLRGRLLVINVDRDNDIGGKTGLETPIVGRQQCLDAAAKLCLADPEEADANAIFATVKMYDELIAKGYDCSIAVLAGVSESGFEADQKVRREATVVIGSLKPEGLVLVSDGIEDEKLAPVLQSFAPIVSIRRIVIKHSASVEETYEVLGRYFKMLIYDPRYSKFFLGVPGALLLLYILVSALGLNPSYYGYAIAFVLGVSFLIRAFDIDKAIIGVRRRTYFFPRLFALIVSLILVVVASVQAYSKVLLLRDYANFLLHPNTIWTYLAEFSGTFILNAQLLVWIAIATNVVVAIVYHAMRKSTKIIRDAIALTSLALLYAPVAGMAEALISPSTANTLNFIIVVYAGLAVLLVVVYFAYNFYQGRRSLSRDES
jgi:putative membrane protein